VRAALVSALAVALAAALAGCDRAPKEPEKASRADVAPTAPAAPPPPVQLPARLTRPAPERLVAIADLHGDLEAVQKAFRLAGAVDARDTWIGGKLVVVQTGDVVDRGDDDKRILDWLDRVQAEAKAAGGELILLLGNHELMNVQGDFRYVTPGGFSAFGGGGPVATPAAAEGPEHARGRAAAFAPGGTYAKKLAAEHLVFVRVGRSVFIHGGILPKYVSSLVESDQGVHDWLLGQSKKPPASVLDEDGLVWARDYSDKPKPVDCKHLDEVLARLDADRLVMGHTVQQAGINDACGGKAWRIDVGMSRYYKGPVQVLEIRGSQVTPLK